MIAEWMKPGDLKLAIYTTKFMPGFWIGETRLRARAIIIIIIIIVLATDFAINVECCLQSAKCWPNHQQWPSVLKKLDRLLIPTAIQLNPHSIFQRFIFYHNRKSPTKSILTLNVFVENWIRSKKNVKYRKPELSSKPFLSANHYHHYLFY